MIDKIIIIGLILVFVAVGVLTVKIIKAEDAKIENCRKAGGVPIFLKRTFYRGFPPGTWSVKEFYKCDFENTNEKLKD